MCGGWREEWEVSEERLWEFRYAVEVWIELVVVERKRLVGVKICEVRRSSRV